jgi:hypothetical protein
MEIHSWVLYHTVLIGRTVARATGKTVVRAVGKTEAKLEGYLSKIYWDSPFGNY